MTARSWACLRLAGAGLIVTVIAVRLGGGPFLTGIRSISVAALVAAVAIGAATTACSAWRWWSVARGLGAPLSFRAAVLGYYRSLFLNSALPGGVIGDLHRGVRHGRRTGDVGRGLRAVLWERGAGQVVQGCLVVVALALIPSPVQGVARIVLAITLAVIGAALLTRPASWRSGRGARVWRTTVAEFKAGVGTRWPTVLGTSFAAFVGYIATFLIAARAVGATVSTWQLVPLAMFVLLVAALPTNIGGWGPREGAAAWAFSVAGMSGAQGVAAGTAYGVLAAAASLPGAIVLIAGAMARRTPGRDDAQADNAPTRRGRALVGAASGPHG